MKRFAGQVPLLLVAATVMSGCQGPSLKGKWQTEVSTNYMKTPITIEFQENGKWVGTMKTNEVQVAMLTVPGLNLDGSGTWSVDGDKLTFSAASVKVANPPAQVANFLPMVEDSFIKALSKYASSTMKFEGDKKAVITGSSGEVLTLTKVE